MKKLYNMNHVSNDNALKIIHQHSKPYMNITISLKKRWLKKEKPTWRGLCYCVWFQIYHFENSVTDRGGCAICNRVTKLCSLLFLYFHFRGEFIFENVNDNLGWKQGTPASICHAIFKTIYLKPKTIAQTPSGWFFFFSPGFLWGIGRHLYEFWMPID